MTTPHDQQEEYPWLATDAIVEYDDGATEGIVLIERLYPPYGVALPGGKAVRGLTLEQNVRKEVLEEIGLCYDVYNPEEPLCVHSSPNRDPRGHMVSVTYIGRGQGTIRAGDDAKKARVYTIPEVRRLLAQDTLCFDHGRAIKRYLDGRDRYEDSPEQYWRNKYGRAA